MATLTPAQAVILAGGYGTRLGALTQQCPKPMLPVAGRPFVEYLVEALARQGVRRILFLLSYLPEAFRAHFGPGGRWGLRVEYAIEPEPLGTGGALRWAQPQLEPEFLVLNGDTFLTVDYAAVAEAGRRSRADAAVALRRVDDAARYGSVVLEAGLVTGFREKAEPGQAGLINGGVYWLRRDTVAAFPARVASLERDIFPSLAAARRLAACEAGGNFIDIGVPATFEAAQRLVPQWHGAAPATLSR